MLVWILWLSITSLFSMVFLLLGVTLSKIKTLSRNSVSPLECGFSTGQDSRPPISLRFFIYAVIFVVFDIELVLVVPLIYTFPVSLGVIWFFSTLLVFLSLGLLYEWNNSAFEWLN